jgi:class 3 adenylate cyclase
VRIGIDSGPAVAVNSGRGSEPEPLFLGQPANYAAKLAEGGQEGIYISDRIRGDLAQPLLRAGLLQEKQLNFAGVQPMLSAFNLQHGAAAAALPITDADVRNVVRQLQGMSELSHDAGSARFAFHHHEPPLRSVRFEKLMPSNSIRMEVVSLFADIDGFTAYVDECIGTGRIQEMVSNLNVMRRELAASLKDDFGGKRVRFIGDCLHGLIAEGTRQGTDRAASVLEAVKTAAGLRSSFELCQQQLPNTARLGLAIGLELGSTPITRLGLRGERSVRCSASKAVSASEDLQSSCDGSDTALGRRALDAAPVSVRRLFNEDGRARGLDYEAFEEHVAPARVISSGSVSQVARPYAR